MSDRELGFLCLGVLIGVAAGAATGLLAAPHSGRHTRRMLRRRGEELQDRISEAGEDWMDRGRELVDEAGEPALGSLAEETRKVLADDVVCLAAE